jgi:hypothetical protein
MKTRNIYLLALLIGVSLAGVSCKKEEPCDRYRLLTDEMKSYISFPIGKYWILANSSGNKDTITVGVFSRFEEDKNYNSSTNCTYYVSKQVLNLDIKPVSNDFPRSIYMSFGSMQTEIRAIVGEQSFGYYLDFFSKNYLSGIAYVGAFDSLQINSLVYRNNIYVGKLFGIYDSLTFSPNVGIIMYYKNGIKYELYESN